jgi:hypothetical protein
MDTILILVLAGAAVAVAVWGWRKSIRKAKATIDTIEDELGN